MPDSVITIEQTAENLDLRFGERGLVRFELRGKNLLGIRDVSWDGVPLRNRTKLWRPFFYTAEGIYYTSFRLRRAEIDGTAAVIETDAIGTRALRMEENDEYLGDMLDLRPEDDPVADRFRWRFTPSARRLDDREFNGFAYSYLFEASDPERKIYRVFDMASWEIGGRLEGNTLLLQGQVNPPVTELRQADFFTTACNYYGAEMGAVMSRPQRVSMQRTPRCGSLQAFDFMTHPAGILFNDFESIEDVMSVVQTDHGEDLLHVVDELRKPLSNRFESHPKHVLFSPTPRPVGRAEERNLWRSALDAVHARERDRYRIVPSPVLPRVWLPQVNGDEYSFGDARGPRTRYLHYLADHVLPLWAESGVKEICAPSYWVSDYTVDRYRCKNDEGLQGGFTVSGICCVREHAIDPLFGGPEAVAYLTEKAHALGMAVQLWWATHLSRRAPIFAERPDFMVRSREGKPGCSGIGPDAIIPLNLSNPDCFEWELDKLRTVYAQTGIDGFFHDSYGNYTFLPVNYNDPRRHGQYDAYGRLAAELQHLGMKTFTIEGVGPWGVGHFGMNLLPSEAGQRQRYQNALDWWLGQEDMLYRISMGIHQPLWPDREEEALQFAFKAMAMGGRFNFTAHHAGHELWTGALREHNRLHAAIAPLEGERCLLPHEHGVEWRRPAGDRLLFAFGAFRHACNGKVVRMSGEGEPSRVTVRDGAFDAEPWSVYRIGE